MNVDWKGDPVEVPWPYLTQRAAAKRLNVSVPYLQGLANNPIPAVKVTSNKGNNLWLFHRDAVEDLAQKIAD